MTERLTRQILVAGRVQGVGFRVFVKRSAEAAGVAGFVRNLHDGRVEAIVSGADDAVAALVEACRRGPAGARVIGVDVAPIDHPERFAGFEIRPDADA